MKTAICILSGEERVKYRLDRRKSSPYFYVYFKGPDGRRREISTQETGQKRAEQSGIAIVRQEFEPKLFHRQIIWDDAIAMMIEHMKGGNLRPNTIMTYCNVVKTFRKIFPDVKGPTTVTPDMANQYKLTRLKSCKPETVKGDVNELNTKVAAQ